MLCVLVCVYDVCICYIWMYIVYTYVHMVCVIYICSISVCQYRHVSQCTCRSLKTTLWVSPCLPPCLGQGIFACCHCIRCRAAGQRASRHFPVSAPLLWVGAQRLLAHALHVLGIQTWVLNCVARALPTERPCQLPVWLNRFTIFSQNFRQGNRISTRCL